MLYISLNTYRAKILYLKKSLLGQYESAFYQKQFQTKLVDEGKIANLDVIASAIKEALTNLPPAAAKEKDITLILPQQAFSFLRIDMPVDINQSVLDSYIKEKVRKELNINTDEYWSDSVLQENGTSKMILFYAIEKAVVDSYRQPFTLLDMQLNAIVPESLAYFKLFEKTLRKDKKENIFYVSYEKDILSGYIYDSFGLLDPQKWQKELKEKDKVQDLLKQQTADYELNGKKLNRLILSGTESETVRQDTFTKEVGAWTNPLKRIIPNFYQEYVKLLGGTDESPVPVLEYDACIGTFILGLENKDFAMISRGLKIKAPQMGNPMLTAKSLPIKPIMLFASSFIAAFLALFLLSKVNFAGMNFTAMLPQVAAPSPTSKPTPPPPTATPTPTVSRKDIKVKVLNGSGVSGKATEVKDLLKEKGYEQILTGNADNFDYETTEVQLKKDSNDLKELISADLEDNVAKLTFTTLDEEEAADIVVIFGADFK